MERIVAQNKRFVDSYGRERIFVGVNVVDKCAYSEENGKNFGCKIDDDFLSKMTGNGMNILRLGTTWSMLEPEPGKYNDEYLDDVLRIFDLCEKHGVYVFLDMHQDLFSAKCYGDGAPEWATITDGYEPKPIKLVWAEGYFWRKATHRAFDNFWNNTEYQGKGLQDYFSDLWKHVAQKFANHPALFGFDIFNEPFLGSDGGKLFRKFVATALRTVLFDKRIKTTKLISDFVNKEKREQMKFLNQVSGEVLSDIARTAGAGYIEKFDTQKYAPFVNKVSSAIREVTDKGIIVMGNCYWCNTSVPCFVPAIEVNGVREENFCFAPHGYDLMVDTPQYKYASNDRAKAIFDEHKRTQERLNVPVLVGEWGGAGGDSEEWLPHIEYIADLFDQNKWSSAYWHYSDGMFDSFLMKTLNRPHPVAVAGEIISYGFDAKAGVFNLSYEQDLSCDEPTVVYVHKTPERVEGGEYEQVALGDKGGAKLIFKNGSKKREIKIIF